MGRTPGNGGGRKYQIQALWDVHHEILRRLVLGQKGTDVAFDLEISPVVVSYVKNSALGKRQLEIMRGAANQEAINVSKRIKDASINAVAVLEGILANEDVNLGLKLWAAQDILDRAGYAPPKVLRTENLHAFLTGEDIAQLKQRAKEVGMIADADGTELL